MASDSTRTPALRRRCAPGWNDAAADRFGARLAAKVDQTEQRVALGKKIVDDQHAVALVEKLLGHDHVIGRAVGVGLDLGLIDRRGDVFGLCLFGKQNRTMKILRSYTRDPDAGGFDGQNFVNFAVLI